MDFKETVKAGYNKIAQRYLEERRRASEDIRLLDDLIARLPADARVLDAGCGAGMPVAHRAQIELAKKHVPKAEFICQDMTELDFPTNSFDGICSYYAIIHIPRDEHQSLLVNFHRMLKPGGYALLCLGAENLIDDIDENFLGTRMYWSHFDAETYLQMLKEAGFTVIWSKRVADESCAGSGHLFVLLQK